MNLIVSLANWTSVVRGSVRRLALQGVLFAALSVLVAAPARAVVVTGTFTGIATATHDSLGLFHGATLGDPVFGAFAYNTAALPANSCPNWGCYLTFDQFPAYPPPFVEVTVVFGQAMMFQGRHYGSQVRIGDYITTQAQVGHPAGYDFNEFGVSATELTPSHLRTANITAITTLPIFQSADPAQSFNLGQSGLRSPANPFVVAGGGSYYSGGSIYVDDRNTLYSYLEFDLTSISVSGGVPEPAGWAILVVGFGGIGAAMRARRHRTISRPRVSGPSL